MSTALNYMQSSTTMTLPYVRRPLRATAVVISNFGVVALLFLAPLATASGSDAAPDTVFADQIRPLLSTHCLDCHSTETQEAGLDIEHFASLGQVRADIEPWDAIVDMLQSGEMPPEGEPELRVEDRRLLITWIGALLKREAKLRAGDPGPALVRRLNNAEYRYTIRDLTGIDLQPTSQFPADNAAGEGFLNATDALAMSPALMNKYLDAAKEIAAHAVLLPDGFRFSPSRFREDWVNEVLAEIVALYAQYTTDLGEIPLDRYLQATIVHRDALLNGRMSFAEVAEAEKLSPKYLELLWRSLTDDRASMLLDSIRAKWTKANPSTISELAAQISTWQSLVWRRQTPGPIARDNPLEDRFAALPVSLAEHHIYRLDMPDEQAAGSAEGKTDAPVVFYLAVTILSGKKDQARVILHRPRFESRVASNDEHEQNDDEPPLTLRDALEMASATGDQEPAPAGGVKQLNLARFGHHPEGDSLEEIDLCVEGSEVLEMRLPISVVGGRIFVVEARPDPSNPPGALLRFEVRHTPHPIQIARTVAWESQEAPPELPTLIAYADQSVRDAIIKSVEEFRDVFPITLCYPGIIVRDMVVTLERFHRGDHVLSKLMLNEQEQQRLDRLWEELHFISQDALQIMESFSTLVKGEMKEYEGVQAEVQRRAGEARKSLVASEPSHLNLLLDFATGAYRRPLTEADRESLVDLYRSLRADDLPHDEAFRATLARILVSTNFLYRVEQAPRGNEPAPISNWELASRLSYFLWSSMPDEELRQVAAEGRLDEPTVLAQQTRRMLQDPRSRALAIEFATQWLEVRNFDQFSGKNLELFPTFDAQLRQAINEEAILFFQDMFQSNRPLWAMIDVDHAFLNERLAAHYDIPGVQGQEFRLVDDVTQHGRGGILGLAGVLAKHSGASRTSPVLRGNWVAETVLGEKLPRPPDEVPKLPEGESGGDLTIRELVEKHAELKQCAVCHQRIDPFGFALEHYDTIGRWRDKDLAGRPVDARVQLNDGTVFEGLDGLRNYLMTERKDDFVRQFCRKLLGFALGRRVLVSDRQLLQEMAARRQHQDARVSGAVLDIVFSKQFQCIRGSDSEE
jgi:hypothetical protein